MKKNTNGLAGMACPSRNSLGPFRIRITTMATIDDTDEIEDSEWDGESHCECPACGHAATAKGFVEGPVDPATVAYITLTMARDPARHAAIEKCCTTLQIIDACIQAARVFDQEAAIYVPGEDYGWEEAVEGYADHFLGCLEVGGEPPREALHRWAAGEIEKCRL